MKVRKVNFSKDGNYAAIYVDGEIVICTSPKTENGPEINLLHIEMWIEGLLWGMSEYKDKLDSLTVECVD